MPAHLGNLTTHSNEIKTQAKLQAFRPLCGCACMFKEWLYAYEINTAESRKFQVRSTRDFLSNISSIIGSWI